MNAGLIFQTEVEEHKRFPRWCSGKESPSQCARCKRCGFDPGAGIHFTFLPGKFHGQRCRIIHAWACIQSQWNKIQYLIWPAESEEELKSLLRKVKEESEKVGLKLNIQKTNIMASGPMANRWGNSGNSDRLYFGGLQNHCRWWLQPWN